MNLLQPISKFMSTQLVTVTPHDPLLIVKEKFDQHHFHHIPVVEYKKIVGIISKSDLLYFLKGVRINEDTEQFFNNSRLAHYEAKDIMTARLATVSSNEPIRTAIDVFKENLFHALPVVDNDDLVGIITTHDIIVAIANERIALIDYASA